MYALLYICTRRLIYLFIPGGHTTPRPVGSVVQQHKRVHIKPQAAPTPGKTRKPIDIGIVDVCLCVCRSIAVSQPEPQEGRGFYIEYACLQQHSVGRPGSTFLSPRQLVGRLALLAADVLYLPKSKKKNRLRIMWIDAVFDCFLILFSFFLNLFFSLCMGKYVIVRT